MLRETEGYLYVKFLDDWQEVLAAQIAWQEEKAQVQVSGYISASFTVQYMTCHRVDSLDLCSTRWHHECYQLCVQLRSFSVVLNVVFGCRRNSPACRRKFLLWKRNWLKLEKRLPMPTAPSNDLRRYFLLVLSAVYYHLEIILRNCQCMHLWAEVPIVFYWVAGLPISYRT